MKSFILKIKRRETPLYDWLYRTIIALRNVNVPSIKFIHLPLYHLDQAVRRGFQWCLSVFWYVPLFKARCERVGKGLRLHDGIPYLVGSHLKIYLGENVRIGRTTIGAGKTCDNPVFEIGNNSGIGYGTVISVSKRITIGNDVMIGPNCMIMDNDDHPIDPGRRRLRIPVDESEIKPVVIGNNVWLGGYCTVLKGVTIGDNSIISAHSVIVRDVQPNCIYSGNPARPTVRDIHLPSPRSADATQSNPAG